MKMQGWGVGSLTGFGILAVCFAACAGDDTPPVDDELRGALELGYGGADGQQGAAGASGTRGDDDPTPNGGSAGAQSGGGAAGAGGNGGSTVAGGGAAGSGPAGGGSGGGLDPNVCDAYTTVLVERCAGGSCHGPGSSQGAFVDGEDALADFIDRPSTYDSCDGLFIDSANPEDSLILTKIGEDFPQGCGNLRMPAIGDFLNQEEEECLAEWLTQFGD